MKIETRFNIGDEVYFIDNDGVQLGEIIEISTYSNGTSGTTVYGIMKDEIALENPEGKLFKTTKELYDNIKEDIKALTKKDKADDDKEK